MNLIIQYYNDANPERQKEYDFCLEKNLNNPAIKKIHNIIEKDTIIPEKFSNNKKLLNIPFDYSKSGNIQGRLTFKYAFEHAQINIPLDEVVAIINLDIFLEHSIEWLNLKEQIFNIDKNIALCLSRYEYYWDKSYKIERSQWNGASSDAWIFLNPIKNMKDCNFAVGNAPGCDGAIARRFYNAGYKIFNWAEKYKLFHVDICRGHKNGAMIITDKTDPEGPKALLRGRLDTPPHQNWEKILNNEIKLNYKLTY